MYLCILTQKGISERELRISISVHGVHDIAEKCSEMWRHLWTEQYFPLAQKNEISVMHITLLPSIFIYLFCLGICRMAALQLWLHWYLLLEWKTLLCLKRFAFSNEELRWNGLSFKPRKCYRISADFILLCSRWFCLGNEIIWPFSSLVFVGVFFYFSLLIKGPHTFVGRWEVRNSLNPALANRNRKEWESYSPYL